MKNNKFTTYMFFSAVILILLSSTFFAYHKIVDPDIGWHLKTAQTIISDKMVPVTDPFSYTSPDKTWLNHEILSELIIYLFYNFFGVYGLTLFNIIMALTYSFILFSILLSEKSELRRFWGLFLLTPAILAVHPRFLERPDFFNIILSSIFILILEKEKSRYYWFLPFVQLAWVNLHGGFIVGIVLAGAWTFVAFIEWIISFGKRQKSNAFPKRNFLIFFLVFAASFLNIYGISTLTHTIEQVRETIFTSSIQEWMSPFEAISLNGFTPEITAFFFVLAISLISFFSPSGRKPVYRMAAFPALVILSLTSVRHIPLFVPLGLAISISGFPLPNIKNNIGIKVFSLLPVVSSLLLTVLIPSNYIYRAEFTSQQFGAGFSSLALGIRGASFLENAEDLKPNLINSYDLGGILILKTYPKFKVFIDGRNLVYGVDFFKKYQSIVSGEYNLQKAETEFEWNTAVIKHNSSESVKILPYLVSSRKWMLVYLDEAVSIFSRIDKNVPIEECQKQFDRISAPWTGKALLTAEESGNGLPFAGFNLAGFFIQSHRPDLAKRVYDLILTLYPNNMEIKFKAGSLAYSTGKYHDASDYFLEAVNSGYHAPDLYRRTALALEKCGKTVEAEKWYKKSLRYSKKDPSIYIALARISRLRGSATKASFWIKHALNISGDNPEILASIGHEAALDSSYDTAQMSFERALSLSPGDEKSMVGLAEVLRIKGEISESYKILDKALKLHPDSKKVYFAYGKLLQRQSSLDSLYNFYLDASQRFPDEGGFLFNLGMIQLKYFSQPDSAEKWFKKAIAILPPSSKFYTQVKSILEQIENSD